MSAAPLWIVGAPFSGVARLAATLGTHPAFHAIPETSLFVADRVDELLEIFEIGQGSNADGLLRALAALEFGGDDDDGVAQARQWLAARGDWSTAAVFAHLRARAGARRLVIPDTEAVLRPADLARLRAAAEDATIVHLVRHPRVYGTLFARWLADRLFVAKDFRDHAQPMAPIDPQIAWLRINRNIETWLKPAFATRYLLLRDEDLGAERDTALAALLRAVGADATPAVVAQLDAADWPFWGYGPPTAPYGLEAEVLESLSPDRGDAQLGGALPWRADGREFAPEIIDMARTYRYG
ncbi:sulfotransferase [Solimonas soli]|uniref:sulfotransferase n=1 Tax=Solimonas soli TaxID=413479 RepID=UPI00048800E0|nr:sulfotransferase [Solimonas soli]